MEELIKKISQKKVILNGLGIYSKGKDVDNSVRYVKADTETFSNKNDKLTPHDQMVFLILLKYKNEKGVCWPNEKTIASIIYGTDESAKKNYVNVSRSISKLKNNGYIEVTKMRYFFENGEYGNYYNQYTILKYPDSNNQNRGWEMIPDNLIANVKLSWQERLFRIQLYPLVIQENNRINLSLEIISKKTGINVKTLRIKLFEMENKNLIEKSGKVGYDVDVFNLLCIPEDVVGVWIQKYQEAEARASYYKAKSNRLSKTHKPTKQEEVEDDSEEEIEAKNNKAEEKEVDEMNEDFFSEENEFGV